MPPDVMNALMSLGIGFALAGMLVSAYQVLVQQPAGFFLLNREPGFAALIAVPFLVFAAPFIIMRNTLLGEVDQYRFQFVTIATVLSGFWSLMSGTVVIMTLRQAGLLA